SQPLDVGLAVEPRAAGCSLGAHEALVLVDAQRLRVHPDELRRDADHVAGMVGGHYPLQRRESRRLRSLVSSVEPTLITGSPPATFRATPPPPPPPASAPGCGAARARLPCRSRRAS